MRMSLRARMEMKVDMLNEQIADMEANNDGTLQWVDDFRSLIMALDEAQAQLNELGGYREANAYPVDY